MSSLLKKLDTEVLRLVTQIAEEADGLNLRVYLVGGCVRDLILSQKVLDLDIVVDGPADVLAQNLARRFNANLTVYKQFGTAALRFEDGFVIDIASARSEIYTYPGALPSVKKGSLKDDLYRRDFTINTLALGVNKEKFGEVVDFFGGLKDIRLRKIRVLHDKSFLDDPTRILRAVRFEQRLRFKMEPGTLKLLKTALRRKCEQSVKPARYFAEFKKILGEKDVGLCLKRLNGLKALGFTGMGRISFSNIEKFQKTLDLQPRWLFMWMKLNDFIKGKHSGLSDKFQLSREERDCVLQSRECLSVLKKLDSRKLLPSGLYQILKPFDKRVIQYFLLNAQKKNIRQQIEKYLKNYADVRLNLNGEDLKRMGMTEGRKIGVILQKILYEKIDGRISSYEQEVSRAQELI